MSPRYVMLASVLVCLSSNAAAGTWYVQGNAGPGGDGHSWATAFQRVQDALAPAQSGDAVWVAQGTYRPGDSSSPRTVTFQIPLGVSVYGGFVGGETSLSQRDWIAHETILSGDLNLDDAPGFANRSDNCYHVVRTPALAAATTGLDGFTVRGGNADGSAADANGGALYVSSTAFNGPTLAHLTFIDNSCSGSGGAVATYGGTLHFSESLFEHNLSAIDGGAAYSEGGIAFWRCILRENQAGSFGGAVQNNIGGGTEFNSCLILGNSATYGGGVHGLYAETYLYNTTMAANHAVYGGGGIVEGTSLLRLYNSIAWGNTDTTHSGLYDQQVDSSGTVVVYSAVQGGSPPWDRDPLWVDPLGADGIAGTADDDLRLSCLSPYIDAGANGYVPSGTTLDLAGAARFQDDPGVLDSGSGTPPIVDLGPYEFSCGCSSVQIYCSALSNSSGGPAAIDWSGSTSLLANAFTLLASGAPPLKSGLFFYGPNQTSLPWGDGIRCVGGSLQRLHLLQTDAAGNASFHLDFTVPPASSGPHAIHAGSSLNFQFMFRDPPGGPAGWNATNALHAIFCP